MIALDGAHHLMIFHDAGPGNGDVSLKLQAVIGITFFDLQEEAAGFFAGSGHGHGGRHAHIEE